MLAEYGFSGGIRGKYAMRYEEGTNIVVINPDLVEYFPDDESINEAICSLTASSNRRLKSKYPEKYPPVHS